MKVWQLVDEAGGVVASVPFDQTLDPYEASRGRDGYGIYEALGADGAILYTGRTGNLATRLRSHVTQSPWWGFAREIRWTPCADYAEAVAIERLGISTDLGPWNRTGRMELPTNGYMHLPLGVATRLVALYAATGPMPSLHDLDLDNYIATLRHVGWTLQSIAEPLSITRERVRQRAARGVVDYDLVVPRPPAKAVRLRRMQPTLNERQRQELQATYELARLCRGPLAADHPHRLASERLTELIVEAKFRGVREREIAAAIGVTKAAISQRLKLHGYMKMPPSMVGLKALAPRVAATHCSRGHEFAGDNLRLVNGDPKRRICRACERIRVEAYRTRKATA